MSAVNEQAPLSDKQERAFNLCAKILRENFSNFALLADNIKIDGTTITTWRYDGNFNAVIGMLHRYKSALINQSERDNAKG